MERPRVLGIALLAVVWFGSAVAASADEDPTGAWLSRLDDASREVKIDTLELLGTFGRSGPKVLARLETLLDDSEPAVTAAAATAFLSLGGDRAIVRSRLRNAKPAIQIGLARVLLGTDETDRQALRVILDLTPNDWSTAFTLGRFSPSLANRMVDDVLERLKELDPAIPLAEDSAGLVYFSLIGFSLGLEERHASPLLALSRTGPTPLNEIATWFLVHQFGREPKIAAALREDLDRSGGTRQTTVAAGVLLSDPDHDKAWQMLRLALTDPDEERVSRTAETIGDFKLAAQPLLPQLLKGLAARDRQRRQQFVEPITCIGPAAVPALVAFLNQARDEAPLSDAQWMQVHDVLQTIGSAGDATAALPTVIARIGQGDQEAITTLCAIGRREPLAETYTEILERSDGSLRRRLIDGLFRSPPIHEETRAMLRTRLPEATRLDQGDTLLAALWLRLTLGEDPAEIGSLLTAALQKNRPQRESRIPLNKLLDDLGPHAREVTDRMPKEWKTNLSERYARVHIPDAAVPHLIKLLQDDSLPGKANPTPSVIQRVNGEELAPDPEPSWMRAASALEKIGPAAHAAIGPLKKRLNNPHRHAATYVLGALSEISGPDDQELVPSVRPFLRHDHIDVHAKALSVLLRVVPDDPTTAEDVRVFLKRCRLRQQANSMGMLETLTLRDAFAHLPQSPKLADAVRADLLSFASSSLVDHKSRCEVVATLCRLDPPDPVARRYLDEWAASHSYHWNDEARYRLSLLAEERGEIPMAR